MYQTLIRPLLFTCDAERIHHLIVRALQVYRPLFPVRALMRQVFTPQDDPFVWRGLKFRNRIGLSAGFDKEAACFDELADFGFGFLEVGTVTPQALAGNPGPRIFRLPQDAALVSRTGFNNPGKQVFLKNLKRKRRSGYLLGININSNTPAQDETARLDLLDLYQTFSPYADYYTINWGSVSPEVLAGALDLFRSKTSLSVPVFLKLPADLNDEALDTVASFVGSHDISGVIACGPTQDRSAVSQASASELARIGAGGISGRPVLEKSLHAVSRLSQILPEDCLLIGAGGVMTEADARRMRQAGAHLVQIYSSFIYEGPQTVRRMSQALSQKC